VVVILFLGLFAWVVMAMALASRANYRHWARAEQ
jgi:hypothetical protein